MQLICSDKSQTLEISSFFKNSNHMILNIAPFIGKHLFQLKWFPSPPSYFLSYSLDSQEQTTLPYVSHSWKEIPPHSFLIIFPYQNKFISLVSLSHLDLISTFKGNENGLSLNLYSGTSHEANQTRPALLGEQAQTPHQALENSFNKALLLTGYNGKLLIEKPQIPSWLNKLGWSTRYLPHPLTHTTLINTLTQLLDNSIKINNVLIEEGWQELSQIKKNESTFSTLSSFDAHSIHFPRGLKGLIQNLKDLGIKHVGITHHVMGSPGGIHISKARKYDLPPDNYGRYFLGYDLGRTFEFYHDYYSYLRKQGITFITVTHQNTIHHYCREGMDVTRLFKNLQTAIQAASSLLFDNAHFNTLCLRNENLFYWNSSRLAHPSKKINLQNSTNIGLYIYNHLSNSVWVKNLMQPTTDIWMTSHKHSTLLAMFHALSTGPTLLADTTLNISTADLKNFVLPSGHLLHSDFPLTLCKDSLFTNPQKEKKIYKAFTFKKDHGILGVFNLFEEKKSVSGKISPSDIENIKGNTFGAFSYHHGFLGIMNKNDQKSIRLKPYQSDTIIFSPLINGVSFIGCHQLFIPNSPIIEIHHLEESLHFQSLIYSPILLYCEKEVLEIKCNDKVIPWDYDHEKNMLTINNKSNIIEQHSQYTITFD
jgi:raffinose synthase